MKTKYNIKADCRGMHEIDIFDTIMQQRGIEDVEHFLNQTEEDLLPLNSLFNIDKAYKLLMKHIEKGSNISVLADVDTDGVTSGAIMTRYLRKLGVECQTFINKGKAHGLLGQDLSRFEDIQLLIVVDSLDANAENYAKLKEQGIDIIVLDHHAVDMNVAYYDYITLVTSQIYYDNPALSGAGVVWKFCSYIDEQELTDYAEELVDLAAVGILADVSDVSESSMENRYIIKQGLDNLNNSALKKIIGSYEFNSKSVLFSVAPLINASCRIGRNETALQMFLSDDNKEVLKCKKLLEECREIQNEEVERLMPIIEKDFESQNENNVLYTIIDSEYGISGLIGNKCLEVYNKPMFILKDIGDRYAGSMRSIGYGDFMALCNETGLAELHGHEEASGIEIKKSNFDKFMKLICSKLNKIKQTTEQSVDVDAWIELSDLTRTLVDKIKSLDRVSGKGFKPIIFKVSGINDYSIGCFKDGKHLVIKPTDYIQLIEWNTKCDYEELEDAAMMNEPMEVYGELDSGFFARTFMLKVIIQSYEMA